MVIQQLQFEMIKTFILAIVSLSIFASAEDQDEERRKPMGRIGRNRPAACRPNPPSPTDQVGGVSAQASTIIVTETIRETQVLTIPGETVLMTQTSGHRAHDRNRRGDGDDDGNFAADGNRHPN